MADKKDKKNEKEVSKNKKESSPKDLPKKKEKIISKKEERKYSIDELCNLFSMSKFEVKSIFLVQNLSEKDTVTENDFRNFLKK